MYSYKDFKFLKRAFCDSLFRDSRPLSCKLYDQHPEFHIPEACNIANILFAIKRILTLPRSNTACNDLSETLILQLDVLREYIHNMFEHDGYKDKTKYNPTDFDKTIKIWAGFIKHPKKTVFAHRCNIAVPEITIDTNFLKSWEEQKLSFTKKDNEKEKIF